MTLLLTLLPAPLGLLVAWVGPLAAPQKFCVPFATVAVSFTTPLALPVMLLRRMVWPAPPLMLMPVPPLALIVKPRNVTAPLLRVTRCRWPD